MTKDNRDEIMRKIFLLSILFLLGLAGIVPAREVQSLEQAKALSAENGKPVLLEFVRTD
jgi:hypothetical protein